MTALAAWLVFPALLVALALGIGLLCERAAGLRLEPALLAPLGFCGGVVLCGPVYALGLPGPVAAAVIVVAAIVGLVLRREGLRERLRPGPATAAGGAVYALYMAPAILTGEVTFLGYNLLNDTSIHLALADYVSEHGRDLVALRPSSYASAIGGYVGNSYPLGSHELFASARELLPLDAARLYQPFLGVAVALAASAVYALLRGDRLSPWFAAAAAALAFASQLVFSFGLQGGIKELTMLTALAAAAALGAAALRSEEPVRHTALLAIPAVAAYAIYGLAALAWIAPIAALLVLGAFVLPRPALRARLLPAAGAGIAVFIVLAAVDVKPSIDFFRHGQTTLESGSELGPLPGPLRNVQAAGIWIKGDYRNFPDGGGTRTYMLIGFALALAALGLLAAVRERALGSLLLLLPALLAWLVGARRGSPYVDAKLLCLLSPAVVVMSCHGVAALWRAPLRLPAAVAGAVLVGAILISDGLAYRVAQPAPMERLDELNEIGERFENEGPMLVNEFEEYVKHFGRQAQAVGPYEAWTPSNAKLRDPELPVYAHAYDLDQLEPGFVASFPLIALRRSPAESRPPAAYELAYRGDWYEVWRRRGRPAPVHLPLGSVFQPAAAARCAAIEALSRRGPVVAAERPGVAIADLAAVPKLPGGWKRPRGPDSPPAALDARTGGSLSVPFAVTAPGRYRVWLRGKTFRPDELLVDGRSVGIAMHPNGPNQWIRAGAVTLGAGGHVAELRRPKRSLRPGDASSDVFAPVAIAPEGAPRIVRVPQGEGRRLCGRSLDWVEAG